MEFYKLKIYCCLTLVMVFYLGCKNSSNPSVDRKEDEQQAQPASNDNLEWFGFSPFMAANKGPKFSLDDWKQIVDQCLPGSPAPYCECSANLLSHSLTASELANEAIKNYVKKTGILFICLRVENTEGNLDGAPGRWSSSHRSFALNQCTNQYGSTGLV